MKTYEKEAEAKAKADDEQLKRTLAEIERRFGLKPRRIYKTSLGNLMKKVGERMIPAEENDE